jgi:hypothetical protein
MRAGGWEIRDKLKDGEGWRQPNSPIDTQSSIPLEYHLTLIKEAGIASKDRLR